MKRWLGWSVVVLVLLSCTAVAVLITTPWGLQWTMARVAGMVPGELHIKTLRGRLIGPIHMEGVEYRQPGQQVLTLRSLDLNWRPLSLLDGTLNVSSIEIAGVHYTPPTGTAPQSRDTGLPNITLPIKVNLQRTVLKQLTIEQPGSTPIQVTEITLTASADDRGVHVTGLTVTAPALDLSLHGTVQPRGRYVMEWHARWTARPPDMAAVAGSLDVSGTLQSLQVTQHIERPIRADINGNITDLLKYPAWRAHIAMHEIHTQALQAGLPAATVTGDIDLKGDFHSIAAMGGVSITGNALPVAGHFDLSYKDSTLDITQVKITTPAAPTVLSASGRITQVTTIPDLDLQGSWQHLRWPVTGAGTPALASSVGHFNVRGGLDGYQLTLRAPVEGARLPPGTWRLAARGDRTGLHLTDLHIKTLDGDLSGQGSIAWRPHLTWQLNIDGRELNPGSYWADFPGRLAFSASTRGELGDQGLRLRVAFDRLDGRIRGYPVQGGTLISYGIAGLNIHHLSLASAETRVTASGTVGKKWDIHWRVTSPALETLLPGAGGSVEANGTIGGASPHPRVNLSLDAKRLVYGQYRADQLRVRGDMDIAAARDSRLTITLQHPSAGDTSAAFIRVSANGTRDKHQVKAAIHTDAGVFSVTLDGGEHSGTWHGTLTQMDLINRTTGYWHLKAPAPMTVSRDRVTVEPLCWQRAKAHVCGSGKWQRGGDWHGDMNTAGIPLQWLQPLLPAQITLTGSLDATLSARQQSRTLSGTASVTLNAAAARVELPNGDHTKFQVSNGIIKARTQDQHILASLNLDLPDTGTIQGLLTLPVSALPLPGYAGPHGAPLEGRLSATLTDLTLLPHFIPTVENTRGTLKTVIDIGGTVTQPAFTGHAELDNGALTIPTLGIQLTQVTLSAKSDDGKNVTLDGSAQSGGGGVTVKSSARLASPADQTITLTINSNRFEAVNIPEAWVLATTDLSLKISASSLEYSGDVFIPEAKLSPRDLSSAVSVSDDTEIVNGALPQPKTPGRTVRGLINLRLGDKVHFTGFGLTAQVKGNLAIQQNPGQPSVGYGTLDVTGEYKAYGQRLTIEQGRLAFVGTPVDNPGLDIKAVRKIKTVTAGINVIGTLKKPRISIFSDPAMDDTDALSYLILGRPVNEASSQEGQRLAGAATALGLAGGEFLAKKLGKMFGIEEVEVKTSPDTQSPSLVLGTYLSPKLYVSYGFGLIDAINTLQLRYRISGKWTLEAQSGLYNGADLLYTIETH